MKKSKVKNKSSIKGTPLKNRENKSRGGLRGTFGPGHVYIPRTMK